MTSRVTPATGSRVNAPAAFQAKDHNLINSLSSEKGPVVMDALKIVDRLVEKRLTNINDKTLFSKLVSLAQQSSNSSVRDTVLKLFADNIDKVDRSSYQTLEDIAIDGLSGSTLRVSHNSILLLDALHEAEFLEVGSQRVLSALADMASGELDGDLDDARMELISKILGDKES